MEKERNRRTCEEQHQLYPPLNPSHGLNLLNSSFAHPQRTAILHNQFYFHYNFFFLRFPSKFMGKGPFSFNSGGRHRHNKVADLPQQVTGESDAPVNTNHGGGLITKAKKKPGGVRLWMRFDLSGRSEIVELDRHAIIKRAAIPAWDLRFLGPIFSQSSNILAREKAMVVNLEFIKAIVTAEEVLLLDPLRQEVIPFVEQLRQQLPNKNQPQFHEQEKELQVSTGRQLLTVPESENLQSELPFEFQALEIALEAVCTHLESNVADLEKVAYPVLDELARSVSTKNLQNVRNLKSNVTQLLARVEKVRDEIEHLLDDNEDMAQLYLTRKRIQIQQAEGYSGVITTNSLSTAALACQFSCRGGSLVTSNFVDDNDVEDLEMLLEAYFIRLDGTRNRILSVREYIDDTEDYVNIQLDNQRNELIQLQLTLIIASFAIGINTLIAGAFGMNIPFQFNKNTDGLFWRLVGCSSAACFLLFLLMLEYARSKGLLGS